MGISILNKIHLLTQQVISKIAAGEVIERPVYAVKELVENSLDSGADSIRVHIEESGLKRITVIDNGEAMEAEDLMLSFLPHATSKLNTAEDLSHVHTLGFRGEALASIAAISKLTIKSKTKNSAFGTSVTLQDGIIEKTLPTGMTDGTQVIVENLFHSVPARRKFLKTQQTEFRHILETVMHFALVYPQVQFILTHNNKTILDLPKSIELTDRIYKLLGKDIYSSLLPLQFSEGYIQVNGFISKPQATTKTLHKQYLYINSRKITDRGISAAIKSAYGTLIEKNVYPICLLFFTMPYEVVDVNVHPKKEEVRLVDTSLVYNTVLKAVSQTMVKNNMVFYNTPWEKAVFLGNSDTNFPLTTKSYAGKLLKQQVLPWKLSSKLKIDPTQLIQIHNLYLITNTENGMAVIDQHAAHERILYEQLLLEFSKQKKVDKIVKLSKPQILELSITESELLIEHSDLFLLMGFEIESFKKTTFLLHSYPQLFRDRNIIELIRELLDDLQDGKIHTIDKASQKMIAYLACRGAVKAGDRLTKKQSKELLQKLEKTPNNAACPHGRPIQVAVDLALLHKMFKR